jgi:hypothetical protein
MAVRNVVTNVSVDPTLSPFDEEIEEATGSPLKSKRYVAKIKRLELSDHPQYGPGVRWVLSMYDPDEKAVVKSYDGGEYEYFQTSGTKISTPKAGMKASKQYRWACAFLNRAIQKGESASQVARDLIGKKAEVFLGPNDNGNLSILAIDPIGTNLPQFRGAVDAGSANGHAAPSPQPVAAAVAAAPKYDETGAELLEF